MPLKDPDARREYHKQYMRAWYDQHKGKHKAYVKANTQRVRAERRVLIDKLKSKPCTDCGGKFPPECMDFDHLYDKKFSIGREFVKVSLENLRAELEKCELVCANCHRTRTMKRRRSAGVVE